MKAYRPKDVAAQHPAAACYERRYRHYQSIVPPVITVITTRIHLYPAEQRGKNTRITYSKGAMIMVALSELSGRIK